MRRREGPWAFSCVSSHTPPCCDVATASAAAAVVTAAAVAVALAATAPGGVSSGAAVSPPWSVSAIVSASYSRGCSIVSKQLDRSVEQKCNATSAAPAAAPRRMPTNRRHSSWTSRSPNSEVPIAWGHARRSSESSCSAGRSEPFAALAAPAALPAAAVTAVTAAPPAAPPASAPPLAVAPPPAVVPFAPLAAGFPAAVLSELRVYAGWAADIKNTHRYEPPAFGMTRKADGASARPDARTVAASGGGRTRRIDRLSRRSTSRRARAQTQRAQYCSTPEPPCSSPT